MKNSVLVFLILFTFSSAFGQEEFDVERDDAAPSYIPAPTKPDTNNRKEIELQPDRNKRKEIELQPDRNNRKEIELQPDRKKDFRRFGPLTINDDCRRIVEKILYGKKDALMHGVKISRDKYDKTSKTSNSGFFEIRFDVKMQVGSDGKINYVFFQSKRPLSYEDYYKDLAEKDILVLSQGTISLWELYYGPTSMETWPLGLSSCQNIIDYEKEHVGAKNKINQKLDSFKKREGNR